MRAIQIKKLILVLFFINVTGQEVSEEKKIKLCEFCTCSEIPNEDGTYVVLNIQCSELDKIQDMPDLDKIEWPDNPNSLKIAAAFEGLGLSTLGKLPQNQQVESLRFNNNAIKTYWPDPFSELPNLKKLSFSQNELAQITPDLFTNVHNLEELDLSYNKLTNFNQLDFKTLHNVKRLNFQGNSLKKIPLEALQPMTSLEDLDLSKNGILDVLLERSNRDTLEGVKRLNLSGNRIRSVTKESFPLNNSLELLDLSNNIIENIETESFLSCPNLRELNIGQNNVTFLFDLPPSVQIAMFRQNTLHRWPLFPPGITYIDLSYNRFEELYDEEKVDFDNLEVLNIAGNQLTQLIIQKKLPKLYSLDLSYNQIEEIPTSLSSQTLPSIEELRLDGNPIQNIYFKNILAVRMLSMSDLNVLRVVEDKAFSNVVGRGAEDGGCFSLHLSNCRALEEIKEGAFAGTSVCMLDISNNNLTHLSESLLDWKSVVAGVDLQHNPWDCTCHLQWMLRDLLPDMYRRHSHLLAQLRCGSPRGLQGLRLVHWYNWTEPVLCGDDYSDRGAGSKSGSFLLEPSTERGDSVFSRYSTITIVLFVAIIICIAISVGLAIYLVKNRKRYQVRQAALKRKRQSAMDARNSNGEQKEQYSALNKV